MPLLIYEKDLENQTHRLPWLKVGPVREQGQMQSLQKIQGESRLVRQSLRLILTALLITGFLTGCAVVPPHERSLLFSWDAVAGATSYRLNRNGEDLAPVQTTNCDAPVTRGDVFFVRAFNDTSTSAPSNQIRF